MLSRRAFLSQSALSGAAIMANNSPMIAAEIPPVTATHAQDNLRVHDKLWFSAPGSVQLSGWIGDKLDRCLANRVMKQKLDQVIDPFRKRNENDGGWRSEFWGKWFTSALLCYQYRPTAAHRKLLDDAVSQLLATQDSSGYIGTYDNGHQLTGLDIWGRKYVMLGLISYFDQTGNLSALSAARREADFLMTQVGPGKVNIADACLGFLKGLSSSAVLGPTVLLYERTGDRKYLDFAQYIVGQWSKPSKYAPAGMLLIEDVLAGVPLRKIDSPKGYEMMSCFEGVCELYRATGDERYRKAAFMFGEAIRKTELMVNGSCTNQELWCNGAFIQTSTIEQPQETCVTATWLKYCCQLLRLSGDPTWADNMEVTLYNALAGAMMPEADWWAYFSPITGQRVPSNTQFQINLSCCVTSGPRALMLTPRWAVMNSSSGPVVNLYAPGTAAIKLANGSTVQLTQHTNYPVSGNISIQVDPSAKQRFTLRLRIPAWSRNTRLAVNGDVVTCAPGTYASLDRTWVAGDMVELSLDVTARAVPAPSGAPEFAVMHGPILLALDNRFVEPREIAVHLRVDDAQRVSAKERKMDSKDVWMAFDVDFEVWRSKFSAHSPLPLTMIDFASAGNQWSDGNLFRTWLPQPLFLAEAYPPHTWKLMYPRAEKRLTKPENM